jgi:hypothetical protein
MEASGCSTRVYLKRERRGLFPNQRIARIFDFIEADQAVLSVGANHFRFSEIVSSPKSKNISLGISVNQK